MPDFKATLQHEDEEKIALYCATHNIEINQANAYDITLEAFKDAPIIYREYKKDIQDFEEHDVTSRIARYIECQIKVVERIADKASLKKIELKRSAWMNNIEKSKIDTEPNIEKLVDNLYRLNIVDGDSYLALVCFLMQLKYTRTGRIPENDKTCVFFNGVARNGKSATAKAICDVEAQYGEIFNCQSGKILESTHEEQVWKSHLNYFDEVKPTDIDRELLLRIVNGGNVELNPKNKKQYNYDTNTNNIFTSNDQISLKQRRVSVIKFGNRLSGRPLEAGTLINIINNIMNALPSFDRYYDIYKLVSIHNENRTNPLAVESVIRFMSTKLGFVNETEGRTLTAEIIFAPHDIYNCIKESYNKQIISTERQEAIRNLLKFFVEKGLLEEIKYESSTTTNYKVSGKNYLKIIAEFQYTNTKDENNIKITKNGLYDILYPFFAPKAFQESDVPPERMLIKAQDLCSAHASLVYMLDDSIYNTLHKEKTHQLKVPDNVKQTGTQLFFRLLMQIQKLIHEAEGTFDEIPFDTPTMDDVLKLYITPEFCQYVSYEALLRTLKEEIIDFGDSHDELIKDLYLKYLGITDENTFKISDEQKASHFQKGLPDGMTIQDSWSYNHAQNKLKQEQKKLDAAIQRRKKAERQAEMERLSSGGYILSSDDNKIYIQ